MTIQGFLDQLKDGTVTGWAEEDNGDVLKIVALLCEVPIGRGLANLHRPDIGRSIGFELSLFQPVTASDFLEGRAWVEAINSENKCLRLPYSLVSGFVESVIEKHLDSMTEIEFREMIARLEPGRSFKDWRSTQVDSRVTSRDISYFGLPIGTLTPNGVVIAGHNHHLFLIGGSNNLILQYKQENNSRAIADQWLNLIGKRYSTLAARGIKFSQLIIPEKASILADSMPFEIDPPTPLYRMLAGQLRCQSNATFFTDFNDVFMRASDRRDLYLKIDSHLTCRGAHRLFSTFMQQIDLPVPALPFTELGRSPLADLGRHFSSIGFAEDDLEPDPVALPTSAIDIVCLVNERNERHLGTRLVFHNARAPFQKRAVAFANSFFSYGTTPQELSWWMMRWFREYHFIWSGDIDYNYIDKVQPDIVIAQTIERFLPNVPNS